MRILVVGATGAQGGGVARHLLRRRHFTVRALTRRPGAPAACELRRLGAEVVEGDLTNRASIRAALKDCYGIFGVTSYAEHLEREEVLGMNLVNAVAGSTIEHFVLSALPSIELLTGAVHRSRQCQIKARLEAYARRLQLPATFVHPAPYFETLPAIVARHAMRPADRCQERQDQPWLKASPDLQHLSRGLPAIAADDIGGVVGAVFAQPEKLFDRTILACGDRRPLEHYAALMKGGAQRSPDGRAAAGLAQTPRVETGGPLANLMPLADFLTHHHFLPDELDEGRALHPEMHTYQSWLRLAARRHLSGTARERRGAGVDS